MKTPMKTYIKVQLITIVIYCIAIHFLYILISSAYNTSLHLRMPKRVHVVEQYVNKYISAYNYI